MAVAVEEAAAEAARLAEEVAAAELANAKTEEAIQAAQAKADAAAQAKAEADETAAAKVAAEQVAASKKAAVDAYAVALENIGNAANAEKVDKALGLIRHPDKNECASNTPDGARALRTT